jgi:hypothetical protein
MARFRTRIIDKTISALYERVRRKITCQNVGRGSIA